MAPPHGDRTPHFPGIPRLGELLSETGPVLAATVPPAAPHARMTLGLSALLDARRILLPIAGAAKHTLIEAAGAGNESFPIATLLRQRRTPTHVFFSSST